MASSFSLTDDHAQTEFAPSSSSIAAGARIFGVDADVVDLQHQNHDAAAASQQHGLLSSVFKTAQTRLAETRAAKLAASLTRALVIRIVVIVWALLVFVLLCIVTSRAGGAPQHSTACAVALSLAVPPGSTTPTPALVPVPLGGECVHSVALDGGSACLRLPAPAGTRCQTARCHVTSRLSAPQCDGRGECVTAHCLGAYGAPVSNRTNVRFKASASAPPTARC